MKRSLQESFADFEKYNLAAAHAIIDRETANGTKSCNYVQSLEVRWAFMVLRKEDERRKTNETNKV